MRAGLIASAAVLALAAVSTGCATVTIRQLDVDAAVRKCGLQGQMEAELLEGRRLTIHRLDADADFVKFDCFLGEVKRMRLDLGIVGQEAAPQTLH